MLKNNLEAEIWSDIYLSTMAKSVDVFLLQTTFPLGLAFDKEKRFAAHVEAARWADEIVQFYREEGAK
jgi:hypothetical protein